MRLLILIGLLILNPGPVMAKSLNGCDTPVPIGQRVLRKGDNVGRALKAIASASRMSWKKGPAGNRWTLIKRGRNPRTIHIRHREGRIVRLCQYSG